MKSFTMMGVRIDPLTMAETVAATEKFVRDKKPLHLMGVNADKLNQCATDEAIKKIVNESEIINADGASVVLAARYLGYSVPERVAGIDLMQELLHLANEKGYSVYFFGAKEEVLTDMLTSEKLSNLQSNEHRDNTSAKKSCSEDIREDRILSLSYISQRCLIGNFMDNGVSALSLLVDLASFQDISSGHLCGCKRPIWNGCSVWPMNQNASLSAIL